MDRQHLERLWRHGENSLAQGRADDARAAFEAIVRAEPGHAAARLRLSTLATRQGRYREALGQLSAVADSAPQDTYLLALLAGALHRFGENRRARDCLCHPSFDRSGDKELLEEAAVLANQLEDMDRARQLLDMADRISGPTTCSLHQRSVICAFAGRLAQAEDLLEASLARSPGHAPSHWAIARLRRQTPERNHVARLRLALDSGPLERDVPHLGFALFKELDDLDRYAEAWEALMRACRGKRRMLDYRSDSDNNAFSALRVTCDEEFLREQAPSRSGPMPIFIVGLPRAGTTLLERILGRHPDVSDAGELDDFPLQLRWCVDRFAKSFLDAEVFVRARDADFGELGRRYLEHAQWRAGEKSWFTDKMPLNFLNVGFIHKALPQAKILHIAKRPMDACLSNLKELFAEAYPYSYDLEELARYYGNYRELMEHWKRVLPDRVLDIGYERLVTEPEAEARRILAFCGLDWRPECLEIEKLASTVTTASSAQVRQPIHTQAIDQWRKYAVPLEPLRRRLEAIGWLEGQG